jgi:hypothetical protein
VSGPAFRRFDRGTVFRSPSGVVGPLHRHKIAEEIRKAVLNLEQQAREADRLEAARFQGEATGLRKATSLLMTPSFPPFERLEPWEIAERLETEASSLYARLKSSNRLQAQRLYGQIAGMRRGAEMMRSILS